MIHFDYKTHTKAPIIKTVWYWHKNKPTNGTQKSSKINPWSTQWEKNNHFNKWCWKTRYTHAKEWNWILISLTKINSKWIKDSNLWSATKTLLEKKHRGKLHDIGFGNDFLHMTPNTQITEVKMDKWNHIKLFCIKGHNQQSEKAT
jgi:hypothetical protein